MTTTTKDLVKQAKILLEEARQVRSRDDYDGFYRRKEKLLSIINDALETGGFNGEAYAELQNAKITLGEAKSVATTNVLKVQGKL